MVGDGARALLERGFAARAAAMDEADLEVFLTDYTAHAAELSRALSGRRANTGAAARGRLTMAVCTNKPVAAAHALLRELGLDSWFSAVGGGDSYPVRKPDPAHLLATLAACDGKPARAVMVGDHHNDILAAPAPA